MALAHFRVGLIAEEIESPAQALSSLEEARKIQTALQNAQPADPQHWRLGDTLNAIGRVLHAQDRPGEARRACLDAIREGATRHVGPVVAGRRRLLANSYMHLGLLEQETDPKVAREWMEEARIGRRQAWEVNRDDLRLLRDLAMGCYNLGTLALDSGDLRKSAQSFEEARDLFLSLADKDKADQCSRYQLAVCRRLLADVRSIQKRWDQAQPLYVQARDEMQDLADKNPSVLEYPVALAEILINMAQAEFEQSRTDAALAGFERAQLLLMPLLAGAARNAHYRGNLIVTLRAVGVLHPEASRRDESRQALRKLRAQLCEILTQSPQDREAAEQLQQLDETLTLLAEVPPAASDTDPGSAAPPEHQHAP